MNINEQFPSNYIKASDLQGQAITVQIVKIELGPQEVEGKPIIYFAGKEKGLVCNKTNALAISTMFGPETDDWIGKSIEIFSQPVQMNNQVVDGIRVRPVPGEHHYDPGF